MNLVHQNEPMSAFAVYSKKSKRKRKSNNSSVTNLNSNSIVTKNLDKKDITNNEAKHIKLDELELNGTKVLEESNIVIDSKADSDIAGHVVSDKSNTFKLTNSGISKRNEVLKKKKKNSFKTKETFLLNSKKSLKPKMKVIQNNKIAKVNINTAKKCEVSLYSSPKTKFKNKKRVILEKFDTVLTDLNKSKKQVLEDNISSYDDSDNIDEERLENIDDSLIVQSNPTSSASDSSEDDAADVSDQDDKKSYSLSQDISELSENLNASSVDIAIGLYEWLIKPVSVKKFMREYWETTPLFVKRGIQNYYSALLSTPEIDSILRNNNILFGKHIDVTSYSNGIRETHNQTGRAQPHVIWDFYANGCSIRLLNPQAFVKRIFALNTTLQEYFGCFVGSNVYLTPPDSQGFAPHYDDIEAFVLQIEGKKRWKVYKPRNKHEYLDRYSSPNFSQEEIGEPMLDIVLEAGDMLYFPRGFIHQGCTVPGEHSLHITLSAYQRTAWVDLLEKVLPMALKRASFNNAKYRRGLPIGYLQSLGIGINKNSNPTAKKLFIRKVKDLVTSLTEHLDDLETAVDQMGTQFMHDALPPVLTPDERKRSVFGDGLYMKTNGVLTEHKALISTSKVKLLRANVCRVIEEEGELRLYYTVDNPLEYHAEEPQYLLLSPETLILVQHLIDKYPEFVSIDQIPYPNNDEDEKFQAVNDLWERGLLLTDRPLEQIEEDLIKRQN